MNRKIRIFLDMDGTIAEWRDLPDNIDHYMIISQPNYFRSLRPYPNMLKAAKILIKEYDVIILSAVLSEEAKQEKIEWLKEHLPEAKKMIFTTDGKDKREFVDNITKDDYLIDDRTLNLLQWIKSGSGIKVLNGINYNHKTWVGDMVSIYHRPEDIARTIKSYIEKD